MLDVDGDIDIGNIADLEGALHEIAALDAGVIVLSLEQTRYIDSRSIYALATFIKRLEINRQRLFVAVPEGGSLRRLLAFSGLLQVMSVSPGRSSAIALARESQALP